MAITTRQSSSLSGIEVPGAEGITSGDGILFGQDKKRGKLDANSIFNLEQKKPGFLVSTIMELGKVNWPAISYVMKWSLVIIIFTTVFSLGLSVIDNTFNSAVQFSTCTAPKSASGDGQNLSDCTKTLQERLLFKGVKI